MLVDCSVNRADWEYNGKDIFDFIAIIAADFDISIDTSEDLPSPPRKLSLEPGETAFDAIDRACRIAAVLPISDGQGGLILTRTGSTKATTALVEGQNILSASADYDSSNRFATYLVLGQQAGWENLNGESASSVKASATDQNVRRTARTLVVRPDGNTTVEHAKKRAQWEATVRAARADSISVTVQGWTQGDGSLWPINALVTMRSPLLGIDGQLLITQATYSIDDGGTTTQLTLRRPDAYTPEPVVTTDATNQWKKLSRGV
jgi:prophage tail gpP-like protein